MLRPKTKNQLKAIKNQLAVFFLSIITLYSCNNDKKKSDHEINKKDVQPKTKENSKEIKKTTTLFSFNNQDNTEITELSGSEVSDNDKFLLVGDSNSISVSKFKKNKESQKLIQKEILLSDEFYYINIDKNSFLRKKIDGVDYFLFAVMESPQGNGDPEYILSFIMVNTVTLKFYTLKYVGEVTLRCEECIDGGFLKNEALESNLAIKKELYLFANQNKWVYNPTGEEKDINYYKNYEQKWHLDNNANKNSDFIKSTYYKENLFQFSGLYDKDQVTENNDFKIVTYFRHNVIGYDKNKKLYFPIIVESCSSGCNKTIEFISKDEIEVSYEMNIQKPDTINLSKIKFKNNQP
ncbi:hypothetical protein AR687_08205 [Flavobacteriaceae bacterium CRH]|nr:hypothetical protein AR687_08205 [Flavobacteriaceae bacterium CRH]